MADLSKIRRSLGALKAPAYFLRQYPHLAAKLAEALDKAEGRKA